MTVRFRNYAEEIRSSYWFVPAIMAAGAFFLSFVTIAIDQRVGAEWVRSVGFIWSGSPEGARGLLSTVAGSMITVAGTTFSITIAAFSLASSQLGSRVLRNFMRDTGNQVVLGTFVATFVYCLMILRTVRGGQEDGAPFVPYVSVTLGVALALLDLTVLIYFIHHAALSIQAPVVVSEVAGELLATIDNLFPEGVGQTVPQSEDGSGKAVPEDFKERAEPVRSPDIGYLQALDDDRLVHLATKHGLVLSLANRPGHFVTKSDVMLSAWPGERVTHELERKLLDCFVLGPQRTQTQDVEFAIDQLVEVAVRALSPGINAPFTAMTCIDWLGAALSRLAQKQFPSSYRFDEKGELRVFLEHPLTFEGLVDAAFNQIRQYARDSVAVRIRLLETIAMIIPHAPNERDREALQRQARIIQSEGQEVLLETSDREDLTERYARVIRLLEDTQGNGP